MSPRAKVLTAELRREADKHGVAIRIPAPPRTPQFGEGVRDNNDTGPSAPERQENMTMGIPGTGSDIASNVAGIPAPPTGQPASGQPTAGYSAGDLMAIRAIDGLNAKLDAVAAKLDTVSARSDATISAKLDAVSAKVDAAGSVLADGVKAHTEHLRAQEERRRKEEEKREKQEQEEKKFSYRAIEVGKAAAGGVLLTGILAAGVTGGVLLANKIVKK